MGGLSRCHSSTEHVCESSFQLFDHQKRKVPAPHSESLYGLENPKGLSFSRSPHLWVASLSFTVFVFVLFCFFLVVPHGLQNLVPPDQGLNLDLQQ